MADHPQSREERRKQQIASKKQKGKKKSGGLWKKILLTLLTVGIVAILVGIGTLASIIKETPPLDPKLLKDPISSRILDMNGNLIAEVGAENREYVAYKDIPKQLEDAIIATEDYRFYQHHGIDFVRLGGALLANIRHGFGSEGGSTITQQVVKNSFLSPQKTLKRKIEEAWLSYELEQKYTKHQILEMYVNKVFMSEGSYGMATAAKTYYGKSLKDLTLPQLALLAGMPQSPTNYNPIDYPNQAKDRRNIVLQNMNVHGYISKSTMEQAMKVPIQAGLIKRNQRSLNEKPYDAFVDEVLNEVKANTDFDIYTDGLTIYTTVDSKAQNYVYNILNTNNIINYPDNKFQAGITLLDTKTGEIRAIGGGRNQQVKLGFNYAIDTRRQPGSTIKPILDYGPAIEYLNWGTYQMIEDKPVTYSNGTKFGNWDNSYMGPMTIRMALALSRNSPAVQTLQQVGLDNAKNFAVKLGIPLKEIYESYAIGGLSTGVSPMEMAGAYSAFGNNGIYTKPHAVRKIELRDGTVIDTTPQPKVVMKDSTAFMITDMMKSVLQPPGTGVMANVPGLPIAGKTGTTNYSDEEMQKYHILSSKSVPDSWFTGFTTKYTASVWTGYPDRNTPILPGMDQKIAQLIFKNVMADVSQDINTPDFTMPNSVEKVRIEKGSMPAALASDKTPDSQVSIEYAVKGHAPSAVSQKYIQKPVQNPAASTIARPTNASASFDSASNSIALTWNYNKPANADVQFDVSMDNGKGATHTTVSGTSLTISKPDPGTKYTFIIVAKSGNSVSDPATAWIITPKSTTEQGSGNQGNTGNNQGNTGKGTNSGGNGTGGAGGTGGTGKGGTGAGGTGGTGTTGTGGTGTTGTGGTGTTGTGGTGTTGTGGTGTTGTGGTGTTGTGGTGTTGTGGTGTTGTGGTGTTGTGGTGTTGTGGTGKTH